MGWFFKKSSSTRPAPSTQKKSSKTNSQKKSAPYRHVPTRANLGANRETRQEFEERIRAANRKRIEANAVKEDFGFVSCKSRRYWDVKWPPESDGKLNDECDFVSAAPGPKDSDGGEVYVPEDVGEEKAADDELVNRNMMCKEGVSRAQMETVNKPPLRAETGLDQFQRATRGSVYRKLHDEGRNSAPTSRPTGRQPRQTSTPYRGHAGWNPGHSAAYEPATPIFNGQDKRRARKTNWPLPTRLSPIPESESSEADCRPVHEANRPSTSLNGFDPSSMDASMALELARIRKKASATAVPHHLHPSRRAVRNTATPKSCDGSSGQAVRRRDTSTLTRHPLGAPLPAVPIEDSPPTAGPGGGPPLCDPLSLEVMAEKLARLMSDETDAGRKGVARGTLHTSPQLDTPEASGDADSDSSETFSLDIPGSWPKAP